MRYTICHTTRFSYSAPIRESMTELRLQPRSDGNQRCLSFNVRTAPQARIFAFRDGLGNTVQYFGLPGRHERLEIVSEALVEVDEPEWQAALGDWQLGEPQVPMASLPAPLHLPADAWDRLRSPEVRGQHFDDLYPSRFVEWTPALRAFGNELDLPADAEPLELALLITSGVHGGIEYVPESTRVDSPIDEALGDHKGVCQDFAHIMIALCRLYSLPARYVSGYLFHRGAETDPTTPGASHAWAELWLPTLGWVGFDPANNVLAGARHIRVAVGRDYADVPPVRGVFKGRAESALSVGVRVALAAADAPDAVAPSVAWPPVSSGELSQSQQQEAQQQQQEAQQQQQ